MTVALVANIARPISSAISTAFSADSYGLLSNYGKLGAAADPDAVIKALFAAGEVGAWYDQSDLTTMFQDRRGATPVTADGQTVGLILDKSKGLVLGSELVTNGTFDSTTTGWTANGSTISNVSSQLKIEALATYGWAYQGITTVIGRTYKVSWSFTNGDATAGYLWADTGFGLSAANFDSGTLTNGNGSGCFIATATTTYIKPLISGNTKFSYFDNISVKELAGNHAVAPSDAARPLKTSTSAADWINYDAVDDVLNSTFPSSLGSSCTVCRANVGAAPTILTAQTIGTSYADSTDHAGLIIINRALTTQETTDVTAWLLAKGATS